MPVSYFVRLRGLPFTATEQDIRNFFGELTPKDIEMTKTNTGKPSGECYVELATRAEQQTAMKKDREHIGKRYVEVFEVVSEELDKVLQRREVRQKTIGKGFIRMKGLPFNATKGDIERFFDGLVVEEVELGREQGSHGRLTGEAYVQLGSPQDADKAMERNGQHVGSRYIDLFKTDGGSFMSFRDRCRMDVTPLRSWLNAPTEPPMPISALDGYFDAEESLLDPYGGKRQRLFDPMAGDEELFAPPQMRGRAPVAGYGGGPAEGYAEEDLEWARRLATRRRALAASGYDDYDYAPIAARHALSARSAGRYPEFEDTYDSMGGGMAGRMRRRPAAAMAVDPRYAPYPPLPSRRGPSPGSNGAGGSSSAASYGYGGEEKERPSPNKLFVRGLPFKVTGKEVEDFFAPYECLEIKLGIGHDGRVTGDAMVEFPSATVVRQVVATKDRLSIGDRYIELYVSTEMRQGLPPNNRTFTRVGGVAPYAGEAPSTKRELADPISAYEAAARAHGGSATSAAASNSAKGGSSGGPPPATDPWMAAYAAGGHYGAHYNVAAAKQDDNDPYNWR